MQTFLPLPSFEQSASCLDRQRLGKQRVECLQILKALRHGGGWRNHSCTRMWRGYENLLVCYGISVCDEWISRGYRDTCRAKIAAYYDRTQPIHYPLWMLNDKLYRSHRSALLYKSPFYAQCGWSESPAVPDSKGSLPYYWPKESEMVRVVDTSLLGTHGVLSYRRETPDEWLGPPPEPDPPEPKWVPKPVTLSKENQDVNSER